MGFRFAECEDADAVRTAIRSVGQADGAERVVPVRPHGALQALHGLRETAAGAPPQKIRWEPPRFRVRRISHREGGGGRQGDPFVECLHVS